MRRLDTQSADFDAQLARLTARELEADSAVDRTVAAIIADVGARGDAALLEYTARFDHLSVATAAELEISRAQWTDAFDRIAPAQREALEVAARRVREFHEHQLQASWEYRDELGTLLGQRVTPLQRVGI